MNTLQFLQRLYANVPKQAHDQFLILFALSKDHKRRDVGGSPLADYLSETDDSEAFREIRQLNRDSHIYFAHGLQNPHAVGPGQRGKQSTVTVVPCTIVDIDLADPTAHKSTNLPATDEDLIEILKPFPAPTWAVHSGFGYHVYWLFDQAEVFLGEGADDNRARVDALNFAFHSAIVEHAKSIGFHVDVTHTLDRVWRLPGFANLKGDPPPIVSVIGDDANAPTYASMEDLIAQAGIDRNAITIAKTKVTKAVVSRPQGEPVTPEEIRTNLKAYKGPLKEQVNKLMKGESFAKRGSRDHMLQRVCSLFSQRFLYKDPAQLAEFFRPSLTEWATEDDAELSIDEEVDKARDKIDRAQLDILSKKDRDNDALCKGLGLTPEDVSVAGSADQFWVLTYDRNAWVYVLDAKRFAGPLGMSSNTNTEAWCRQKLPPSVWFGEAGKKTYKDLINDATILSQVRYSITSREAKVRRNCVSFEMIQPLYSKPEAEPLFHAGIHRWLELMGSDDLLRWVASVPLNDRPTSMLYLYGPKGIGKTVLAQGLSRLWSDSGAADGNYVLNGQFNDVLLRNPLLFFDEGFEWRSANRGLTRMIRSYTANNLHTVNPKGRPAMEAVGYCRLMMAANNEELLNAISEDIRSKDDVEAICSRILSVGIESEDPARYLLNKGREEIARWIEDDLIAKHAMYLAKNTDFGQGDRFLVPGNADQTVIGRVALSGDVAEYLAEYVYRYILHHGDNSIRTYLSSKGTKLPAILVLPKHTMRRQEWGSLKLRILLRRSALSDTWSKVVGHAPMPRPAQTTRVLSRIGKQSRLSKQRRNKVIDLNTDYIRQWVDNFGDLEEFDQVCQELADKTDRLLHPERYENEAEDEAETETET